MHTTSSRLDISLLALLSLVFALLGWTVLPLIGTLIGWRIGKLALQHINASAVPLTGKVLVQCALTLCRIQWALLVLVALAWLMALFVSHTTVDLPLPR